MIVAMDKGVEPEAIEVAEINGKQKALLDLSAKVALWFFTT